MKLAAIEGMWEAETAPAAFTLFGFPDQDSRETHYAVRIPWVMGLIGTRSLTTEIPGIDELVEHAKVRIRAGIQAYDALPRGRSDRTRKRSPGHSNRNGWRGRHTQGVGRALDACYAAGAPRDPQRRAESMKTSEPIRTPGTNAKMKATA